MARMTDVEKHHMGLVKDLRDREELLRRSMENLQERIEEVMRARMNLETNTPTPKRRRP